MSENFKKPVWNKSLENVEQYYTDLYRYIANQLNSKLDVGFDAICSVFNRYAAGAELVDDYGFMFCETGTQLSEAELYDEECYKLKELLKTQELRLSNISFPVGGSNFSGLKFIDLVNSVTFDTCGFIAIDDEACISTECWLDKLYFKSCIFEVDITVSGFGYESLYEYLFDGCTFKKSVMISNGRFDVQDHNDENNTSTIPFKAIFNNTKHLAELHVCGLYENLPLFAKNDKPNNLDKITLENCKVMHECKLYINAGTLIINNVIFNKLLDCSNSTIKELMCNQVVFKNAVSFQKCTLGLVDSNSALSFSYVDFVGFVNFRETSFISCLDLVNNKFHHQPNFLSANFKKEAAESTSRETFRIIKHSFNAVGNNVEANRFFAYEMEAYRSELKINKSKGSAKEKLLLDINWLISNHGQSYIRALVWWFGIIIIIGIVLTNAEMQFINVNFPVPKWWRLTRDVINGIAKGFIPFSPIYKEYKHYEAFIMLMGLMLSAVTWHLLVALRRHSKK